MMGVFPEFIPASAVEPRPVYYDPATVSRRHLDSLKDFVYIRSNIPGPGSDTYDWEENLAGCECSSDGDPDGVVDAQFDGDGESEAGVEVVSACDSTLCSCVRIFGPNYRDSRLIQLADQEDSRDASDGVSRDDFGSEIVFQRPILECGSNCSCRPISVAGTSTSVTTRAATCENFVVGAGIALPFLIFREDRKGFGLKCLELIPAGKFVCEYAGEVVDEDEARRRIEMKRRKDDNRKTNDEVMKGSRTNDEKKDTVKSISRSYSSGSMNYIIVLSETVVVDDDDDHDDDDGESLKDNHGGVGDSDVRHNEGRSNGDSHAHDGRRLSMERRRNAHKLSDNGGHHIIVKKRRERTKTRKTIVDAERCSNVGHFINHSCQPNLVMMAVRTSRDVPRLALFARREIQPMEELTFHYGGNEASMDAAPDSLGDVECLCHSDDCVKRLPFDKNLFHL